LDEFCIQLQNSSIFFKQKPQTYPMSNKNLLLAGLVAWLLGSIWWQKNRIMNCSSTEVTSESLAMVNATDSLTKINTTVVADSISTIDSATVVVPVAGTTEDDLAKSEKYSSVFKPMNLYFHTNQADYIKTDDNQKFLNEAKAYLAEHKDKSLSLTGHTDSDGAEDANQRLSEKRSIDVKKQLSVKGFSAEQLSTDAKGETQPMAPNDTPEGKKANRRVTIVVNQ
jgi:outer membrane protein OmpA-like peptidoglycan-associated protein